LTPRGRAVIIARTDMDVVRSRVDTGSEPFRRNRQDMLALDAVSRGQALLTMEAMKMEHLVTASADGVVTEVRVAPGQQVDAGLVLVVIEAREDGAAHGR
jgi:hypothetical protein